jgi:hypothetical protein
MPVGLVTRTTSRQPQTISSDDDLLFLVAFYLLHPPLAFLSGFHSYRGCLVAMNRIFAAPSTPPDMLEPGMRDVPTRRHTYTHTTPNCFCHCPNLPLAKLPPPVRLYLSLYSICGASLTPAVDWSGDYSDDIPFPICKPTCTPVGILGYMELSQERHGDPRRVCSGGVRVSIIDPLVVSLMCLLWSRYVPTPSSLPPSFRAYCSALCSTCMTSFSS